MAREKIRSPYPARPLCIRDVLGLIIVETGRGRGRPSPPLCFPKLNVHATKDPHGKETNDNGCGRGRSQSDKQRKLWRRNLTFKTL